MNGFRVQSPHKINSLKVSEFFFEKFAAFCVPRRVTLQPRNRQVGKHGKRKMFVQMFMSLFMNSLIN